MDTKNVYLRDKIKICVDIELSEMLPKVPDTLFLLCLDLIGLVEVDIVVGPYAIVVDWPDVVVVIVAGPMAAHSARVIVLVQQSQGSGYVTLIQTIS
jgi:hypothetical protein